MAKLRLASWNVNGIRAIAKKGFFEWLDKEKPDIVGLQETKIMADQLTAEIISPKGYKSFFCHAERKGYSGVAIYTRHEPISIQRGFGRGKFDEEGRTLIADFGDFVLFNIYYPNGKMSDERLQYKLNFYEHFLEYVTDLTATGKRVIVCGDFNTAHMPIDLSHPKRNEGVSGFLPDERAWMDKFVSSGYVDTFRLFNQEPHHYSWWHLVTGARARNVGWRIDYFFASINMQKQLVKADIRSQIMGSDHCPVTLTIEN